MKPFYSFALAITFAILSVSAEEVEENRQIVVSYDFDFDFFTKLVKKWRDIHDFGDDKAVRINPRGLIEAGGLKLAEGESFIHHNVGSKSIIIFLATRERHQIFREIYKKFMGVPVREISNKEIQKLREPAEHQTVEDSPFGDERKVE